MALGQIRDLLTQVQTGARVSTAIGEPITVGDRVIIPVAEIGYGGGGGGGQATPAQDAPEGTGGGGGMGVRIRPLGCWVIGPNEEKWVPAVDVNRMFMIGGAIAMLFLGTIRAIARHR